MGIDDIFHFDAEAYTVKASQLPTAALKQRETQKIRQYLSGSCTVGLAVGTAAVTGGVSLAAGALAARNMRVARKKGEIIQAELARRGAPLKEKLTAADKIIPVISGVAGHIAGGVVQGALVDNGVGLDGHISTADATPTVGDFVMGDVAGGAVEHSTAWGLSKLIGEEERRLEEAKSRVGCTRLLGWNWLYCDGCEEVLENGVYAHCCECNDSIDFCMACYNKTEAVPKCGSGDPSHGMVIRQVAVEGICDQAMTIKDFDRKRSLSGAPAKCCHCSLPILQGRIFTCETCKSGPNNELFNLCTNCYFLGERCPDATNHRLRIFLAAQMPTGGRNISPYEQIFGAGVPSCDLCGENVTQGAYYQCTTPPCKSIFQPPTPEDNNNDNDIYNTGNYAPAQPLENFFDICHDCYDKGATCQSPSCHQLTLYFSYDTSKHWNAVYAEPMVSCDICKTLINDEECYHCPTCENSNYDICSTCYMTGSTCRDPKHVLVKLGLC